MNLSGDERARYVRDMFAGIAPRYDLMNRIMTGGQDVRWRRKVIRLAQINNHATLLDLGTGTGDLAKEALSQFPRAKVIGADFTIEMMRAGRRSNSLNWTVADALCLPFSDSSFVAVVSGFLMRNVIDLDRALAEQYRVLKSGGRIVILDTTRPNRTLLSPLIRFHMHTFIPLLGRLITGVSDAYRYLPESTDGFVTAENMANRMIYVGFENVGFQRLMFGTVAIHHGDKG